MTNPKTFLLYIFLAFYSLYVALADEEAPAYRFIMPEEAYEYFKEDVFQGAKRIDWFDFETGVKYQLNKTAGLYQDMVMDMIEDFFDFQDKEEYTWPEVYKVLNRKRVEKWIEQSAREFFITALQSKGVSREKDPEQYEQMLRFPEENGVSYGGEKYLQHKMDEYMDSSAFSLIPERYKRAQKREEKGMKPETEEMTYKARTKLKDLKGKLKDRMKEIRSQMGEEEFKKLNMGDDDDEFEDDEFGGASFIDRTEKSLDDLESLSKSEYGDAEEAMEEAEAAQNEDDEKIDL